jgi:hypothetical protein
MSPAAKGSARIKSHMTRVVFVTERASKAAAAKAQVKGKTQKAY